VIEMNDVLGADQAGANIMLYDRIQFVNFGLGHARGGAAEGRQKNR